MTPAPDDTQPVLDLVQRWAAAELAGDVDAYDTLIAADFTGIGPAGFILTGEQWAQRHLGDLRNDAFDVLDPQVRFYGDPAGTALVDAVLEQKTTARGRDTSGSFRLGLAAVRAGRDWRLARVQFSGPLLKPGETPPFAR